MRHTITDTERGHRPPISRDEETGRYSIRLVKSTKAHLLKVGAERVRSLLDTFAEMDAQKKNEVPILDWPVCDGAEIAIKYSNNTRHCQACGGEVCGPDCPSRG